MVALEKDLPGAETEARMLFDQWLSSQPSSWQILGAYYLLRRGIMRQEVVAALARLVGPYPEAIGDWDLDAPLKVAQFDAKRGRKLLRRALGAPFEVVRVGAIAALAALDQPWADELLKEAQATERSEVVLAYCQLAAELRRAHGRDDRVAETASVIPSLVEPKRLLQLRLIADPASRGNEGSSWEPDEDSEELTLEGESDMHVRYYGTVRDLFEDQVEQARRWLNDWQPPEIRLGLI